ncbi:MAG: AAA family ATPase [Fimbriimonadales bacterium]|nr:AAA family ATPase [Fimbriimonadales bacterium]
MRFLRLVLEGYGCFRERTAFEFDAGLNCFVGANESGKSTVLAALLDALYTTPTTSAQAARERISWGHPHGWQLELELELRGERIRLLKFHPTDDPRRRATFLLEHHGEQLSGEAARTRWEQLWRVPQEVYLATACVRQREIAHIAHRTLKSLQQQLRESAVNADLNRILSALQQERRRLRAQVENLQRGLQEQARQLHAAREVAQKRHELRQRLHTVETEIATLDAQLAHETQLLERWHAVYAQQERLEQLRRQADANQRHLDQLEQLERRARELETELETQFGDWASLPSDLKTRVDAAYMRYQDALRRLHALAQHRSQQEQAAQAALGRGKARVGYAVLGAALCGASLSLWGLAPILGAVALVLGVLALLIALFWRGRTPSLETPADATTAQQEIDAYRQELVQLLQQAGYTLNLPPRNGAIRDHATQFTLQLQQAIQQFSEQWNALQQRRAEIERVRHRLDALHSLQDPKALREQQRELAIEIVGLQEQLRRDPLTREGFSTEAMVRLEHAVAQRQQHLEALQAERLRCEGALQTLPHTEPLDALEQEHAYVQQRVQQLQYRVRLLEATEQLLTEANARYLSDLSPRLKPRIEHYLPALTLERYTQAQLDENLNLWVYHPECGETLPVEEERAAWSAGVLDQLFFACRLGLSDALADDLRLPLLLDDPFVYFDLARYRAALELLTRIATETQVILFTCRPLPEGSWGRVWMLHGCSHPLSPS